jgi:hypothetical protein
MLACIYKADAVALTTVFLEYASRVVKEGIPAWVRARARHLAATPGRHQGTAHRLMVAGNRGLGTGVPWTGRLEDRRARRVRRDIGAVAPCGFLALVTGYSVRPAVALPGCSGRRRERERGRECVAEIVRVN